MELTEGRGADGVSLAAGVKSLIRTAMDGGPVRWLYLLFVQTQHGEAVIDLEPSGVDEKSLVAPDSGIG